MAILGYAAIVVALAILCFLYAFHRRRSCRNPLLNDWPILGMLPRVLWNLGRIHDFIIYVSKQIGSTTGEFKGPWFTDMNYLVTFDSINVHHILSKNFDNYVKGSEFREIFEAFGDGFFTSDFEIWSYSRTLLHSLFKNKSFEMFVEKVIQRKVQSSLLPILDHFMQQGTVVDLQQVFGRFTFDNTCSIILGYYDPNILSIDFPEVAIQKAFDEIQEIIFYRHIVPTSVWKLQKWLQIGQEKKKTRASKVFDQFLYERIASKREELSMYNENDETDVDLLTILMRKKEKGEFVHDDKFLRDLASNLLIAGRDAIASALTWFFWLVATHPLVEAKILEEIKDHFAGGNEVLGMEDVKKLFYLHGAICEALRLFPPIPFQRKNAVKADILPSGHQVNPNTMIVLSFYAMGRLEEIWGKDCMEVKPERWISERGGIVHVPFYKFVSFNAGPRTCLGKDLSFMQMKMVAVAILRNYRVHLVEGHTINHGLSLTLLMKHGLKVRITRRD